MLLFVIAQLLAVPNPGGKTSAADRREVIGESELQHISELEVPELLPEGYGCATDGGPCPMYRFDDDATRGYLSEATPAYRGMEARLRAATLRAFRPFVAQYHQRCNAEIRERWRSLFRQREWSGQIDAKMARAAVVLLERLDSLAWARSGDQPTISRAAADYIDAPGISGADHVIVARFAASNVGRNWIAERRVIWSMLRQSDSSPNSLCPVASSEFRLIRTGFLVEQGLATINYRAVDTRVAS